MATILLVAISLAMDAFAVSIAHSMTIKNRRVASGLMMAVSFGAGFHASFGVASWFKLHRINFWF